MTKIDRRTHTPRQEKLINLLLVNLGTPNKTRSLRELVLEAGYSEAMAKNPLMILKSETIKEGLSHFINQLDDKRRQALTQLTVQKMRKSPARDLAYITDILTKNHQLLGGGATERIEISPEEKKAVDDAFLTNT